MDQRTGESAPPKGKWLKVGELNMWCLDWGGTGDPVIALHGLASSCHWYDLVIPHLRDSFRFVAPDQRAHGKTDQPSSGYDWQTLAGDVVGALDRQGIERAAVIGNSWGGSVALSVAGLHPDRVTALALVEGGFSSGPRSPDMTWEAFKERLSPRDIYGPPERYLGALRRQFAHCWSDQLERMVMTMVRRDPDGTVQEILEPKSHEQILWAMWSDPPSRLLPEIRCPTLMVAGDRRRRGADEEFSRRRRERLEATQAAIPNSRVTWIADAGHDIGYEKPVELAAVLRDFLADATT